MKWNKLIGVLFIWLMVMGMSTMDVKAEEGDVYAEISTHATQIEDDIWELSAFEEDDWYKEFAPFYKYEIVAKITNVSEYTWPDAIISMNWSSLDGDWVRSRLIWVSHVSSSTGEFVEAAGLPQFSYLTNECCIGDVEPGETITAKWIAYVDYPEVSESREYRVMVGIENGDYTDNVLTLLGIKYDNFYVSNESNKNTFVMGEDQWNFPNYYGENAFGDASEDYYMTDADYNALLDGLDAATEWWISTDRNSEWGGSCYGMAVTSILQKANVLDICKMQDGAENLYQMEKKNNDELESLINFYQLTQHLDSIYYEQNAFFFLTDAEQLEYIENIVSLGQNPVALAYGGQQGAHTVVAYGMEEGEYLIENYKGTGENRTFTNRILIYDSNSPEENEDCYLYYDKSSNEWDIPVYDWEEYFLMACNKLEVLDCKNYETSTANYRARLYFEGQKEKFELMLQNLKYIIYPGIKDNVNGLFSFFNANMLPDGTFASTPLILTLPDNSAEYTVSPMEGEESKFTMRYENTALIMDSAAAEDITFHPNGKLEATGIAGEYTMGIVANEGYNTLPWHQVFAAGKDGGAVCLEQVDEGILMKADNLQDVEITVKNREEELSLKLDTEETDILLTVASTDNGEQPVVMLDPDEDGVYDVEWVEEPCDGGDDCPSIAFCDVDQTQWYHEAVDYVVENGYMAGVSEDVFDTHGTTSRAMIVTILYKLEGKPEVTTENPFTDVGEDEWYADAVVWAASNGIVDGYGEGKFGPNDNITREQMAVILYSYAKYKEYDVSATADLAQYTDAGEISSWANEALAWANAEEMITGYGDGNLGPKGEAERCQAAAILKKFCEVKMK